MVFHGAELSDEEQDAETETPEVHEGSEMTPWKAPIDCRRSIYAMETVVMVKKEDCQYQEIEEETGEVRSPWKVSERASGVSLVLRSEGRNV